MKVCTHGAAKLLPEYILGQLDPEAAEMVERHAKNCASCSLEMRLLRKLEKEEIAEPGPWFYESLPARVTAEARTRKKKRVLSLVPAWAAGAAAVLVLVLMFLRIGPQTPLKMNALENEYLQGSDPVSLGLGEEIPPASTPTVLRDLDQIFVKDLEDAPSEALVTENDALENEGYETLDAKTMRVFENMIEDMTPQKARGKVMS